MFDIENNHLKLFEEFNLENTRDRLIKVSMEMFAEIGYDKTSVRELASRSNANIAAINYHFGGKEGLYQAVLEFIIQYMDSWAMPLIERYNAFIKEQNGNFDEKKTISWLNIFMNAFVDTTFESYESNILLHKIIAREQLKPTLGFNKIYGLASLKLAEDIISDILSKVSNVDINDERIVIHTISIVGQIKTFTSANSPIREQLKVKDLNKKQINLIKELINTQIENSIYKLLKR